MARGDGDLSGVLVGDGLNLDGGRVRHVGGGGGNGTGKNSSRGEVLHGERMYKLG